MTLSLFSLRQRPIFAGVAAVSLALSACGGRQEGQNRGTPEVGFVTVATSQVTLTSDLAGRATAMQVSEVRPQVGGIIQKRLFTEGAAVKAGDPLYQIDPATFIAARDQAKAMLASARATLEAAKSKAARYKSLSNQDAVSKQDADDVIAAAGEAAAAVGQADAELKTAEINLAYTTITAPISGTIGRSAVTAGALVTNGQTTALATIQQLDPILIDVTESSTRILAIRKALASGGVMPASADIAVELEDGSTYPQKGKIAFAEQIVDENTGTVTIRAQVPNPDGMLLPGMYLRVTVAQGVVPQGILVPQQGITRDPKGGATALVVGEGDKVELRTVTADRAIGDKWLISQGLKVGDRLIVEGTAKAQPGAPVKPVAVTLGAGG